MHIITALFLLACVHNTALGLKEEYHIVRALQQKIRDVDLWVEAHYAVVEKAYNYKHTADGDDFQLPPAKLLREYDRIEKEADAKRQALYRERNEVAGNIPGFWQRVLEHHHTSQDWMTRGDHAMLSALKTIQMTPVKHADGSSTTITFTFHKNDYFFDETLWREDFVSAASLDEYSPHYAKVSGIRWKPGKQTDSPTFFDFFQTHKRGMLSAEKLAAILVVLTNDFQRDPTPYLDLPTEDVVPFPERLPPSTEGSGADDTEEAGRP